jgi:hypothetical protein
MKTFDKIYSLIFCWILIILVSGCQKKIISDFGFDGAFSGKVVDQSGNLVPGDITSANLTVKALGTGDIVTIDMRVKGDGTFQNTKLFPKSYRIWISGPLTMVGDTVRVDLAAEKVIVKDIVVVPFISLNLPAVVGNPTATSIDVSFALTANSGKVVSKRELYCSTIPFPNASTGSGPSFASKTVALTANSGNASITGLVTKTKYYIRIGAQATGATGFNFSGQIEVTTL